MTFDAERIVRATARSIVALAVALFAAVLAGALALAPTGSAAPPGPAHTAWHPLITAEIPPEPADPEQREQHAASTDDRDDGDEVLAVRSALAGLASERAAVRSSGRRRGIRSPLGRDPRGPPIG